MLPILRILPVGGVFLAILLLVLALGAPERVHVAFAPRLSPMRGPLIALGEHPEWRQFVVQAAIRRADELNRLRDLPDTPARAAPARPAMQIARLPAERIDTDPEPDVTGSIVQPPPANIPIDIGEASSIELPVVTPDEPPPAITPARLKSGHESRVKTHARRARLTKPQAPAQFDLFTTMFGAQKAKPAVSANAVSR